MSRASIIDTPFPSLEETAEILGVSASEAKRVQSLMTLKHRNGRALKKRMSRTTATTRHARKKSSKKA